MTSSARLRDVEQLLDDEVVLIVVAQVVRGHGPEVVDDPARQLDVRRDLVPVVAQQCGQHLLAVNAHRADPGEVIEPGMTELHGLRGHVQPLGEQALETDGDIAEPDRTVAVVEQRARDDAHRVGEIDDPRVVRSELPNAIGDVEHHRDGAQGFGESAGAGRLLPDAAAAKRDGLVGEPCRLAADADLQEHG